MKKGLLFITVISFLGIGHAQDESSITSMGGGGFTIGYGNMNVSALNLFAPASVSAFSNNQILMGGAGNAFIGRLVLGGGGTGIMGDEFVTDSLEGNVSGGIGTFDFGYALISKDKLKFFPMIGIGGGGYGITITKTGNLSTSDVVNNPGRGIGISQGGMVADFSLNLYTIPALAYDKAENSYGGLMLGLKVGYIYSIPNSTWSYAGGNIINGERFGLSMPYAKLIIGGFGFSKSQE